MKSDKENRILVVMFIPITNNIYRFWFMCDELEITNATWTWCGSLFNHLATDIR